MAFKPPFNSSISSLSLVSLIVSALATFAMVLVSGNLTVQGNAYLNNLYVTGTIMGVATTTISAPGTINGELRFKTGGRWYTGWGGIAANTIIANDSDYEWVLGYENNDTSYVSSGVRYANFIFSCGGMTFSEASSTYSFFTMVGENDQARCFSNAYGTTWYSGKGIYLGDTTTSTQIFAPSSSNKVKLGTTANSFGQIVSSSTVQGVDFFATTSTGGVILKTPNGTCARQTLNNSFVIGWATTTCPSL